MLQGLNSMADPSGFFNEGILNYLFGQQQSNAVEQQHALQPIQQESEEDQQELYSRQSVLEKAEMDKDWSENWTKYRDTAWDQYKKDQGIKPFEDKHDEYMAKQKFTKDEFFINKDTFDPKIHKAEDQPDWLKKTLWTESPKHTEKLEKIGKEYVRMKDGSLKKVYLGTSWFDATKDERSRAWKSRHSGLIGDDKKSGDLKNIDKTLYFDLNDESVWAQYTEKKKDWRGRELAFPYNIRNEDMWLYNRATEFQEMAQSGKGRRPTVFFEERFFENPYYSLGEIYRKNYVKW